MSKINEQTEVVKEQKPEKFAADDWKCAAEILVRSIPVRSESKDDWYELIEEPMSPEAWEQLRAMIRLEDELEIKQQAQMDKDLMDVDIKQQRVWRLDTGEEITKMLFASKRDELMDKAREKKARAEEIDVDFGGRAGAQDKSVKGEVVANQLHLTKPKNVRWLWPGYIPTGKVTIFAGDPGMGKSTIALDLIARITRGTFLPCAQDRTPVGDCSIATAEDDDESTVVPRLIAAGADRRKVQTIRQAEIQDERVPLKLPRDYERIRAYIHKGGLRLLVIDPLSAFMERGTDSYKDIDMRDFLSPMEEIANETDCAIVIIAHLNKKEDASSLYRIGGSIGFIAAARSVLAVMTRAEDGQRLLYSLKCNLARRPLAIEYSIQDRTIKQDIHTSKIEWLSEIDFDPMRGQKVRDPQSEEARQFWKQILVDGEMPSAEIEEEAKRAGIGLRTLKSVKYELGITSEKRGEKWCSVPPKKWKK